MGGVLTPLCTPPTLGLPGRLYASLGVPALERMRGLFVEEGASPFGRSFSEEADALDDLPRLVEGVESSKTVRCSVFRASSISRLSFSRLVAEDEGCDSGRMESFAATDPTSLIVEEPKASE